MNAQQIIDMVSHMRPDDQRELYTGLLRSKNGHSEHIEAINTDTWEPYTLADAYQPRPTVEYIASNLFALPSLNIVYGAPGTLKSFLLADLAICVAAGIDWLPPAPWVNGNLAQPIVVQQSSTMWIDFDNGVRRSHDRFAALGRSREIPTESPITYFSMPDPWLDACQRTSIDELSQRISDRGVKLVVIDNLSVVSGKADENSIQMGQVMSLFRQVAEETHAALVLIHHQRKGTRGVGRAGDNLRGHSSIEAAIDLALVTERKELSDTVVIKPTKVHGADLLPLSAVFTHEDDLTGELVAAQFFGLAINDDRSGTAIEREIGTALSDCEMNKSTLVKVDRTAITVTSRATIRHRFAGMMRQ
jgi:hypothetical protein